MITGIQINTTSSDNNCLYAFLITLTKLDGWYSGRCKLVWKLRAMANGSSCLQLHAQTLKGTNFLLTPTVKQIGLSEDRIEKRTAYRKSVGRKYSPGSLLEQVQGLIGTPTSLCSKGNALHQRQKGNLTDHIATILNGQPGEVAYLFPPFVMEMMGFPTTWTLLPFSSAATNAPTRHSKTKS